MTRSARRSAAAAASRAATLLLAVFMLWTLGVADPGGADAGPALSAPAAAARATRTAPPPSDTVPAADAVAAAVVRVKGCEGRQRPTEHEDVGHSSIRLRCTVTDTRLLKTPDDVSKPQLRDQRADATVRPHGHDGRPRASRTRTAETTRALLQVFRC